MNKYKIKFQAECPNNGHLIDYLLEINTNSMIEVEKIIDVASTCNRGFHEKFADLFHQKFGGKQYMTAIHCGVIIETTRGV